MDVFDLISATVSVVTLVLVIVLFVARSKPTAAALDQKLVDEVRARQQDRAVMEFWERAYRETAAGNRAVLDVALAVISKIAPFTPIKADDAIGDLLEDIQTPGAPAEPETPPMTAEEIAVRLDGHLDPNALG